MIMMTMQEIAKMARRRPTPPESFVTLCKELYGDVVDPTVVWTDVVKMSPDQADLNASGAARKDRMRRNVERTSNAVGIGAGSLGLAAAMKDSRLAAGGPVARGIARTGARMPEVAGKIAAKSPKLGGALAAGAVATQVGNLGGDALIAGTLGKKPDKQTASKSMGTGSIRPMVEGLKRLWDPQAGMQAAQAAASPRQAAKAAQAAKKPAGPSGAKKAGDDVGRMLSTTSGKVATGIAGAATLGAAGRAVGNATGRNPQLTYVPDQYAKRADDENVVVFKGTFTEFDDSKRQAFGWASVVKINGQPVVDRQGDYIAPEDLEAAAYAYVHKSRVGGDMHRRNGEEAHKVSDMIESMVFTDDKVAKLGLPDDFPRGWWVGYQIHDEPTWDLVRKGGRTGFSIHGKGIRRDHSLDDLMGY